MQNLYSLLISPSPKNLGHCHPMSLEQQAEGEENVNQMQKYYKKSEIPRLGFFKNFRIILK